MEDLLRDIIAKMIVHDDYPLDLPFLLSIHEQIGRGKSLTARQTYAARNILRKIIAETHTMILSDREDMLRHIKDNIWRTEIRITVEKRTEARYLGDNVVALSYSSKQEINDHAMLLKAVWRNGVQIVLVTAQNIDNLITFLGTYHFEIDESLEDYLALCLSSKGQITHLIYDDGNVVCNVCDSETTANFLLHIVGAQLI